MLMFFPLVSFAQKENNVMYQNVCVNLATLESTLQEFEEIPFVRGLSNRDPIGIVSLVIFVNPKTGSWSIIEKIEKNRYCILAVGNSFEAVPNNLKEELKEERKGKSL
jgi:hypothetical protein